LRFGGAVKSMMGHRHKIEPDGFKAKAVTFDRECCVLYKATMDEITGDPECSARPRSHDRRTSPQPASHT